MGSKVNGRKLCPWFQLPEACEYLFPLLTIMVHLF